MGKKTCKVCGAKVGTCRGTRNMGRGRQQGSCISKHKDPISGKPCPNSLENIGTGTVEGYDPR